MKDEKLLERLFWFSNAEFSLFVWIAFELIRVDNWVKIWETKWLVIDSTVEFSPSVQFRRSSRIFRYKVKNCHKFEVIESAWCDFQFVTCLLLMSEGFRRWFNDICERKILFTISMICESLFKKITLKLSSVFKKRHSGPAQSLNFLLNVLNFHKFNFKVALKLNSQKFHVFTTKTTTWRIPPTYSP